HHQVLFGATPGQHRETLGTANAPPERDPGRATDHDQRPATLTGNDAMIGQHKYGWRPDTPDIRDQRYAAPRHILGALPPSVGLRPQCPGVYDQGDLGSCTANGIGFVHEFCQMKQREKAFTPSRLFIYYNERAMEGTVNSDAGAEIRDGIKSINK